MTATSRETWRHHDRSPPYASYPWAGPETPEAPKFCYYLSMRREEIIRLLREHRVDIDAFGVRTMSLFGSAARDEAGPDSDVDILVEFTTESPTFRQHMGLLLFLEDLLRVKVDLATPRMLPPGLATAIQNDLLRVA